MSPQVDSKNLQWQPKTDTWAAGLRNRRRDVRRRFCLGICLLLVTSTYILTKRNIALIRRFQRTTLVTAEEDGAFESAQVQQASLLHLIVPATSPKPNLCRSLLSAAILDYPLPVMINWAMEEDPENEYKMHLAKITGILQYLRGLPARNDNDLVLIVDGYDIWFQLRPEVLIQRYFKMNEERNARIIQEYDKEILQMHKIRQTVIFGADKKCWPQTFNHPACYAVPESTLPADVFGPSTDQDPLSLAVRPRWLNSGTILGPVADVRSIFEHASRRVEERFNGMRDQWYFAELFGEQEYYRNSLRKQPKDFLPNHITHIVPTFPNPRNKTRLDPLAPNIIPDFAEDAVAEFHIGLDYEARLFHTNGYADQDAEWSQIHERDPLAHEANDETIGKLPEDIRESRPPVFRDQLAEHSSDKYLIPLENDEELPFNTTWEELSLLRNIPAQNIPAMIHLNGNKSYLDEWWQQNWFVEKKLGRHLLRDSRDAPRGPLTTTIDTQTGEHRTWWKGEYNSLHRMDGGMWTATGAWLPWKRVCSKYSRVLFDGLPAGTPPDPKLAIDKAYQRKKKLEEQERLAKLAAKKTETTDQAEMVEMAETGQTTEEAETEEQPRKDESSTLQTEQEEEHVLTK